MFYALFDSSCGYVQGVYTESEYYKLFTQFDPDFRPRVVPFRDYDEAVTYMKAHNERVMAQYSS